MWGPPFWCHWSGRSRLLLTYVLPVIPLLVAWDGTASALRAYTPQELLALAASVPGAERYTWETIADQYAGLLRTAAGAGSDAGASPGIG